MYGLGGCGMRLVRKALALLLPSALMYLTLTPGAHSQDVESVASAAKASVAVILVQKTDGSIASGTAFMAAEKLALTAAHVVVDARRVLVKFPDYSAVDARVAGSNSDDDVAVLNIPALPVRPLPLGDVAQVREGQRIIVVGFPRIEVLGAETATVTEGIISAVRPGLIQMQAPINPGSSGGPVLNLKGEVVGIVRGTLRGQQQGLNFAAPINAAKPLLGAAITGTPLPPQAGPQPPPPPAVQQAQADPFLIQPGQSIGSIRLGLHVEAVTSLLGGPHKRAKQYADGSVSYYWYEAPKYEGIGVRATRTGEVYLIWVQGKPEYSTKERLHVGSREAEIKAVLGEPSKTEDDSKNQTKELVYDSLGIWFDINLSADYSYYNAVYQIGVVQPK